MRILKALVCVLIGAYFILLTRDAVHAYFTPDDLMNLYNAWIRPLHLLVRANLLFWEPSPFIRPLPEAWYRLIYSFAGFDPRPFHIANLAVLCANIFFTYAVARRLSGSWEVGALTALLGAYHTNFAFLYFDTGYVFDVLCYFFYFAGMLFYLRIRDSGRYPGAWHLGALALIYICALNSKEMAVTVPAFLCIYECIYHPPRNAHPKELWRWLFAGGRGALLTGAVVAVFLLGRLTGAKSLAHHPGYTPMFTWPRFMETSLNFLNELFLVDHKFTVLAALLLWGAMLVLAWIARSRTLLFAWLFVMLSAAPVAFIPPRGASQYYVVLFGWVLYAATALTLAARRLIRSERVRVPVVFVAVLLLLFPFYRAKGWSVVFTVREDASVVRDIATQLHQLHPRMAPGARLMFLNDPLPPEWAYNMTYVASLSYRDDSLVAERARSMARRPDSEELAAYQHVFGFEAGHYVELFRPWKYTPAPTIILTPRGSDVFHEGWVPVSPDRPAAWDEMVISRAIAIGPTAPAVGPDRPFPNEPLARVTGEVKVRVNGRLVDVGDVLGWPGEVGIYRVDFRVPAGTPAGRAKVEIEANGAAGPPSYIPVTARLRSLRP